MLENRQHSFGISGEPAADIYSSTLPGELLIPQADKNSFYTQQTVKKAISEIMTALSAKLSALPLLPDLNYLPVSRILAAAGFVETLESYKNRQLTQNFGQTVTRNIVESFPQCLYFSITEL